MSLRCECGEKASYIWFDHNPDRLIPVCDRCLYKLIETFGEVNLDVYEIDDPDFLNALIKDVNEQFKWHDDLLKRLRNEVEETRKWKAELRKIIHQIKHEPAHSGFPPSYRYMEGWLDGVSFTLKKIKEAFGEEASKE